MHSFVGYSTNSDPEKAISEATSGIGQSNLIMFISSYNNLKAVSEKLSQKFPGTPVIGTSGTSYYRTNASDKSLVIMSYGSDAEVSVGVLRYLSTTPLYDIKGLADAVRKVSPGQENTVCLEFCTNDEERLVTSMNTVLEAARVPLVGGSVFGTPEGQTSYVSVNGVLYDDACCYAVIKNKSGKIRTYSENIYNPLPDAKKHIATKVNLATKELIELDGRPAADVYGEEMGLHRDSIVGNVLKNPLGRVVGSEVFISSMYAIGKGGSLVNYKRINENDTITILDLGDYRSINQATRSQIKSDNKSISFVFSVNCIYRHLLFSNEGYLNTLLQDMSALGSHVGVVGGGEQYKKQHVNQTMVCTVFE